MGETNAVAEARKTMTGRAVLAATLAHYEDQFRDADGRYPATFRIITMTAWAPAESQQKPLRPGSAQNRLADALGSREVSLGEKARPKS